VSYYDLGDKRKAIEMLNVSLDGLSKYCAQTILKPGVTRTRALIYRGNTKREIGLVDESIDDLTKAVEAEDAAPNHNVLGILVLRQGRVPARAAELPARGRLGQVVRDLLQQPRPRVVPRQVRGGARELQGGVVAGLPRNPQPELLRELPPNLLLECVAAAESAAATPAGIAAGSAAGVLGYRRLEPAGESRLAAGFAAGVLGFRAMRRRNWHCRRV
jgi:hypothetical protein